MVLAPGVPGGSPGGISPDRSRTPRRGCSLGVSAELPPPGGLCGGADRPCPPQAECKRYGPKGHLASIHSQGTTRVLAQYVSSQKDSQNVWIGLHDEEHVSVRGCTSAWGPCPGHPLKPLGTH